MARPCKFWAQGTCNKGDRCNFDHIGPPGGGGGGGGGNRGGRNDDNYHAPRDEYMSDADGRGGRGGARGGRGRGGYQPGGYQPGGSQGGRGGGYQGNNPRGGYQGGGYQGNNPRGGFSQGGGNSGGFAYDDAPRARSQSRGRQLNRGGRGGGGNTRYNANDRYYQQDVPATKDESSLYQADQIYKDLTEELEIWPLSVYAPGSQGLNQGSTQLFEGPEREQSFEEMRMKYYIARANGQEPLAQQEQDIAVSNCLSQVQNTLQNIPAAIEYLLAGANEHPNRNDIVEAYNLNQFNAETGEIDTTMRPFKVRRGAFDTRRRRNQSRPPASNAFQIPNTFQNSQPAGQAQGSPFALPAQSNAFGGNIPTPFGQAQQANAFAIPQQPQVNPLGGGSFGDSEMGSPQVNAFPQPNGFAAPQGNAFGGPPPGGFGMPQQPAQTNALGASLPNAFNTQLPQPNGFGGQPAQPNAFTAAASQPNGFGAQQPPPGNPFGIPPTQQPSQPNGFSLQQPAPAAQGTASFALGNTNGLSPNPFGAAQPPTQPQIAQPPPQTNGTAPSAAPPPSNGNDPHPDPSTYLRRDFAGNLSHYKNRPLAYRDEDVNHTTPGFIGADGQWERIWFPDGPPPFWNAVEGEEARYTEEDRKAWDGFRRTGVFEGRVPREPPQGDWCRWDF